MRVAVIGTGRIGSTVGAALSKGGQDVVYGSRHPDSAQVPPGGQVVAMADALDGADAVLLALPAQAVADFVAEHGAALTSPLIVDATNNVGAAHVNAHDAIADAVAGVRYARAFSALGFENFADPLYDGEPADLFFSASESDREVVEELITAVGLRPAYLGADKHDVVDHALPLWFALVQQRGNRGIALRVLER